MTRYACSRFVAIVGAALLSAATASAQFANGAYKITNKNSAKCVDAANAGTANGTIVQQYACNTSNAQIWQLVATDSGYYKVLTQNNTAQGWDINAAATTDGAKLQLWASGSGTNQQFQAVAETGGYYHLVARHDGKCIDVPNASTADAVQLQQWTCNGTAAQAFQIVSAGGATPTSTATATARARATATATAAPATVVSLSSAFNVNAAYSDGTTFPATGGLDGVGSAYSSTLLGASMTWSSTTFNFGAANQLNGVRNATITLPAGQFGTLLLLGTAVNGDQASQAVRVNYTDGTSSTFTQTFSNWLNASQNVAGQAIARSMAYRNKSTGVADNRAFNLYGYSFALTSTKTVSSLVLPANNNVVILAATLRAGATATATATATSRATATRTATPTATATSSQPNVVTLYQDCNFAGVSAGFPVGSYTAANITSRGGANEWASSIRVTSGYCATLYADDNYGGNTVTLGADQGCLTMNALNDKLSSLKVVAGGCPAFFTPPPATWQEHWFEHVQNLSLIAYNDDVALYFDADVDRAAQTWLMDYLTRMWRYVKSTYGNANQTRLFSIHHTNKYFGGHPAYWYDASHDNRNVSDVGLSAWTTTPDYDIVTHETGHIIESVAHGKKGSPAFGIWGDSKWAEFYIYDIYVALGMTTQAQARYNQWIVGSDSFPRAGTFWFRDWFYPLWRDHGHAQVMVRFNQLLGQYFPTDANGNFTRGMNMGEYVHFMSGAAQTNLKAQATTAFGWPANYETEFNNARAAFPQITY